MQRKMILKICTLITCLHSQMRAKIIKIEVYVRLRFPSRDPLRLSILIDCNVFYYPLRITFKESSRENKIMHSVCATFAHSKFEHLSFINRLYEITPEFNALWHSRRAGTLSGNPPRLSRLRCRQALKLHSEWFALRFRAGKPIMTPRPT